MAAKPRVRYEIDTQGIGQLANGPEMRAMLHQRAELGAQFARSIAPHGSSGDYAANIKVVDAGRGGPRRDRAAVDIVADVPYAVWVETGSRGADGHHVLNRTVDEIEAG
jgi:hypothetical protein